jgi:hypothetical protein
MTIERSSLVDKVRGLLAKTVVNGCTEAEAMTALAKARAMIDAYEISETELALTKQEKAVLRQYGMDDRHDIKRFLSMAVAAFAGIKTWRNAGPPRQKVGLTLCGLSADVDFAEWLINHLSQFVANELTAYLFRSAVPKGQRRRIINGFTLGCCTRINDRLYALARESERTQRATLQSRALVLADIKREAIKETMTAAGIRLTQTTTRRKSDPDARGAGAMAGDRATFGRPVDSGTPRLR